MDKYKPPGLIKKIYFQKLTFGDDPFRCAGDTSGSICMRGRAGCCSGIGTQMALADALCSGLLHLPPWLQHRGHPRGQDPPGGGGLPGG